MKSILKNKPDYEEYSENVAVLTTSELRELGLLGCGGCKCTKKNCNVKGSCCKSKKAMSNNGESGELKFVK